MSDETKDNVVNLPPPPLRSVEHDADGPPQADHVNQMLMNPATVLRLMADQIEKEPVTGVLVLAYTDLTDGEREGHVLDASAPGLSWIEQIAVMELPKMKRIHQFNGVTAGIKSDPPFGKPR